MTSAKATLANQITKSQNFFEAIKFPAICVSTLASLGFFMLSMWSYIDIVKLIALLFIVVGIFAAILSGPMKYVKTAYKLTVKGWSVGWEFSPFFPGSIMIAFIGAMIGMFAGYFLAFVAPALIGFYDYFKN